MESPIVPKLEKTVISAESAIEKVEHLFKPLGKESRGESNEITIENESIKASFLYEDLKFDINTIPKTEEDFIGTDLDVNDRALIRFLNFETEKYSILQNFILENKKDGSKIDLNKELGENNVYVKKGGNTVSGSASHSLNPYIKLSIEPKTAAGILVLMHEVGHKKDPAIDPLEIMLVALGKEKEESVLQKEMIDRERYAWAYGLSKLRPYIKGLNCTLEDLDIFVHQWNLGSYSAYINTDLIKD